MTPSDQLVESLINQGALRTPEIIGAFGEIDRADFVPEEFKGDAYVDTALPLGLGQTISQPYTVAFMLELLQPQKENSILDVGYGSGWQTALLAHIVGEQGHITALEIIPELCDLGEKNLAKYSYISQGRVEVHCINAQQGYPTQAPFDRIIAAAAGNKIPSAWHTQTKVGGRIVVPVGDSLVQCIRKSEEEWEEYTHSGFVFVPLIN